MSAILQAFTVTRRTRAMPPHLAGTDRVLLRWAVSIGDGTTDMSWHELARAQVPPLDDQTAIVVDQLVLRSPTRNRRVVELWYRTTDPVSEIARRLHVRRELVPWNWQCALDFMRARFMESPLRGLRRMAEFDVEQCPTLRKISLANDGTAEVL